jgi:hypothetical protein
MTAASGAPTAEFGYGETATGAAAARCGREETERVAVEVVAVASSVAAAERGTEGSPEGWRIKEKAGAGEVVDPTSVVAAAARDSRKARRPVASKPGWTADA